MRLLHPLGDRGEQQPHGPDRSSGDGNTLLDLLREDQSGASAEASLRLRSRSISWRPGSRVCPEMRSGQTGEQNPRIGLRAQAYQAEEVALALETPREAAGKLLERLDGPIRLHRQTVVVDPRRGDVVERLPVEEAIGSEVRTCGCLRARSMSAAMSPYGDQRRPLAGLPGRADRSEPVAAAVEAAGMAPHPPEQHVLLGPLDVRRSRQAAPHLQPGLQPGRLAQHAHEGLLAQRECGPPRIDPFAVSVKCTPW